MNPLARLSELGATAQAAIPGLYAWAVSVLPAATARDASLSVRFFTALGAVALLAAPVIEARARGAAAARPEVPARLDRLLFGRSIGRSAGSVARAVSIWGLVVPSAVVWALSPAALAAPKFDASSGALGLVGWALFAFACAGPALQPSPDAARARILEGSALEPRSSLPRGDGAYVAAGVIVAFGMQLVGWSVAVPERAVLVRLVTLAAGVAVLGAATDIALARHARARKAPVRRRVRVALPWLLIGALVLALGWVARMSGVVARP